MTLTNSRPTTRRAAVGALTAATLVGAMSVVGPLAGSSAADAASGHKSATLTISTSKNAKYGTILVSRTTVYTLKASSVACTAKCLKVWPEVLLPAGAKKALAGRGVVARKLGTLKRAGGRLQVTYAGAPLYWFYGDHTPGRVTGNVTDTWGKWSVVVTQKPSGHPTTTTTTVGGAGGIGF